MMTKKELISVTSNLVPPGYDTTREYSDKIEYIVDLMNKRMLARDDLEKLVGTKNIEMMKDNHANHARFMESVFYNFVPEVLVDTIIWVFRAYHTRGFQSAYWTVQLNGWMELYHQELSKDCCAEIIPIYKWMLMHVPDFNTLAVAEIETD